MDESAVRKYVAAHLGHMLEDAGISGWTVTVEYGHIGPHTQGNCSAMAEYNQAQIRLDPEMFGDETTLAAVLRHELFHIVLAPMDVYRGLVTGHLEMDTPEATSEDLAWTYFVEQSVLGLERMWAAAHPEAEESSGQHGKRGKGKASKARCRQRLDTIRPDKLPYKHRISFHETSAD